MAKTVYNSTILAADLLLALRKNQVASSIVNRNYQGSVQRVGDTVSIVTPVGTTIRPYGSGTDITVDELDGSAQTLTADQANYFAFYAHDTDNVAAAADAFVDQDAYKLADEADKSILKAHADAGMSVAFDSATDDILAKIREARKVMDLANVPSGGRWLVLSPYECEEIEKQLSARDSQMGDGVIRAGFMGELYGFDIFKSNNLEVTDTGTIRHGLAGYSGSITYVDAIVEVERMRAEKRFADLVRGLHVFGHESVRSESLLDFTSVV
jgi:hypothetical protein